MTKALIVGYGSIGRRHCQVLSDLGCSIAVVSRRQTDAVLRFAHLDHALDRFSPDYVVVADETARHFTSLSALAAADFDGRVLVEKPLFSNVRDFPVNKFEHVWVGYNLRFHPVLQVLNSEVAAQPPICWQINVGQNLNQWRPGRSLKNSYSASVDGGGGALRDLSHEIDYLVWLAGMPTAVAACGGNFEALGVEADEAWSILFRYPERQIVSMNINILDQFPQRSVRLVTGERTLVADLMTNRLSINGETREFSVGRNETYKAMHQAVLDRDHADLCSVGCATKTMLIVEAIERAQKESSWAALS